MRIETHGSALAALIQSKIVWEFDVGVFANPSARGLGRSACKRAWIRRDWPWSSEHLNRSPHLNLQISRFTHVILHPYPFLRSQLKGPQRWKRCQRIPQCPVPANFSPVFHSSHLEIQQFHMMPLNRHCMRMFKQISKVSLRKWHAFYVCFLFAYFVHFVF